jgi:hypothetical protein
MKHYRDIWRAEFGEIPKDVHGWSYEIHHIDGDRSNNSLENLRLVSIEEHYQIHLSQGDLNEANAVLSRIRRLQKGEIPHPRALSGSKWYHRNGVQKQLHPENPIIEKEGWIKGMLPSTVDKIRQTSHKATRPSERPFEVKVKIAQTLKKKYESGERVSNAGRKYNK